MPKVMLIDEVGGKPGLVIRDLEPTEPGPGEVRYRVHAIGLNRSDLMYMDGVHYAPTSLPSRVASEACGIVDAVGPGVTRFAPGDRVSAIPYIDPRYYVGGEWAITLEDYLTDWPDGVPAEEGCAFWMQYVTAYFPLKVRSRLGSGKTILIVAASSSAGIGAIHLARLLGAEVIATSRSHAKAERLREQGAHHVIATDEEVLDRRILEITGGRGVDVVYDPMAGDFNRRYVEALAEGARVYIYGFLGGEPRLEYDLTPVVRRGATIQPYNANRALDDPAAREEAKLFLSLAWQSGRLRPLVDRVFPLDQAREAYEYMRSGQQVGKIVLRTALAG
jgi:NADPH:quinone reductase-like Zn-dependent oxidoreductase